MKNIFVSSTFRDMQAERDLIQEEVLPQLKSKAKEYGENINMIDLRWGVDTSELESEEGSMKVMSVCLDEVERSRPHMLIFLGERYGSIIDPAITERVIARKDSSFKLDDYAISITAMEVEFGALSEQFESLENCVVCMRSFSPAVISDEAERAVYTAEDEERAKKQKAFREKVANKVQGRVIEYTCDWDENKKQLVNFRTMDGTALSERLITTYETIFQKEWDAYSKLSWEEKEQLAVGALQESKLRTFSGREALINHYYERIISETGALILQGEVGSGKTSIMCKLMEKLLQDGKKVFRFVAGNSSMSETAMQLVQQLVYYLENVLGEEHFSGEKEDTAIRNEQDRGDRYSSWLDRLEMLASTIGDEEKIYVVIDALDQMYLDESLKMIDFVLANEKLRYVMSCTSDFEFQEEEREYELVIEQVPLLDVTDAKDVIKGIMTASSRNVYKDIEEAILAKKSANNPLYISMLIQRLNMMGFEELYSAWTEADIIRHSIEVIENMPDKALDAAVFMLDEAIVRLDAQNAGLKDIVNLIGVSRGGLRESDILAITKEMGYSVKQLDISRLIHYLDTFFVIHKDGQIDFTHKVIRRGIYAKADHERYIRAIAAHVKSLGPEEDFWKKEGMYYARMTKDAKFAETIFAYAGEQEDEIVLDAIKAEGLADKGDFYCGYMAQMEGIEEFFCFHWNDLFDLKREETNLKERVCLCFAEYLENKQEEKTSEKMLRYRMYSYWNKGRVHDNREEYEQAFACLKKAVTVAELLYKEKQNEEIIEELCDCYDSLGTLFYRDDKIEDALVYYEKAFHIREHVDKEKSDRDSQRNLSISYHYRGITLCRLGVRKNSKAYIDKGLAHLFRVKEISEKLYEEEKSITNLVAIANLFVNMGQIYHSQRNDEEAIAYYEKAIKDWEKIYAEYQTVGNLKRIGNCFYFKADAYATLKRWEDALECYFHALSISEKVHRARQNYDSLIELKWVTYELANILRAQGRSEEAIGYYKKTFNMAEQIHRRKKSLESLQEMVCIYADMEDDLKRSGKAEEQRVFFRKILEMTDCMEDIELTSESASAIEGIMDVMNPLKVRKEKKAIYFYEKILKWILALDEKLGLQEQGNLELLETCYQNLAVAYADQKNVEKAQAYYLQFSEVVKMKYKVQHGLIDSIAQAFTNMCVEGVGLTKKIRSWIMSDSKKHKIKWKQIVKLQNQAAEYSLQGGFFLDQKDYIKAEEYFRKALALNEDVCSMTSWTKMLRELAIAYNNLAYAQELLGEMKAALELYKKGLSVREKIYAKKATVEAQREVASCNSYIGKILQDELHKKTENSSYNIEVNVGEAPKYYEAALNDYEVIYKKTQNLQDLERLSAAYYELGYILRRFGKKEAAYAYYMRYLETKEELHEKQQTQNSLKQLAICYNNVGYALYQMGKEEDGEFYSRKSLQLEEELYMSSVSAESMESLSTSYYNIAKNLIRQRKDEAAMEYYKKCVDMAEEFYRAKPSTEAYDMFAKRCEEIGGVLLGNGQVESALACYEKLVLISEERCEMDPKNAKLVSRLEKNIYFIASVLRRHGKQKDAVKYYQKCLTRAEKAYEERKSIEDARSWYLSHVYIGEIYEEIEEWTQALWHFDEALKIIDMVNTIQRDAVVLRHRGLVLCRCSEIRLKCGGIKHAEQYADEAYISLKLAVTEYQDKTSAECLLQVIKILIQCHIAQSNYESCENYFKEMEVLIEQYKGNRKMDRNILVYAEMWELKGDYYAEQGELEVAKVAYKNALEHIASAPPFIINAELKKLLSVLERKIAAL